MNPIDIQDAASELSQDGRRNWERLEYQTFVVLTLDDGRTFEGITLDVSLGGAFIQTTHPPLNLKTGDTGEIHISGHQNDGVVFPSKVIRVSGRSVAVEFRGNHATFGVFVTHGMLLELLTRINNSFARSQDLESTLTTAVQQIKHYLQAEAASLFLVLPHTEEIVCRACAGPVDITGVKLSIHEGIVGRSIREGVSQTICDVNQDPGFAKKVDESTGFSTRSIMCAPLIINNETLGALEVINKRGTGLFAGHDQVVLNALSSATAMAINHARQAEELRRHRDELEVLVETRTADLVIAKEQAEEATRLKDKFVALVAHDLRSPLAAIQGSMEYILEEEETTLSENQSSLLASALNGSKNLIQMIEEVLNISRLKTGKITLEKQFFNAHAMVQEISQRLDHLRAKKRLAIDNVVPVGLRLFADRTLIGEVLQNLLSNAIKFSLPETTIQVSSSDRAHTILTVQDQGVGISETALPKLFTISEKTSTPGTQGERGTGFGLPFSFDIMQAHAGTLTATSTPGTGSLFSLSLPAVHPRVLIVDDEVIVRTLLKRMLIPLRAELLEASNGREALACLQNHPVHLILADINMPVMSGFELLEKLQRDNETKNIPFMLITVDSDMATRDQAFRLGASDFAIKPFQVDELLPRIRNLLGG